MMFRAKKTLNVLVLAIAALSACSAPVPGPTPTIIAPLTVSPTTLVVVQDTAAEEKELAVLRQTLQALFTGP